MADHEIKIGFNGTNFTYKNQANADARKQKVKREKTVKWTYTDEFAIHFSGPAPCSPFVNTSAACGSGEIKVEKTALQGSHKYFVAVLYTDGKIYMDDPEIWVEP